MNFKKKESIQKVLAEEPMKGQFQNFQTRQSGIITKNEIYGLNSPFNNIQSQQKIIPTNTQMPTRTNRASNFINPPTFNLGELEEENENTQNT
jgi:hypothetical protein